MLTWWLPGCKKSADSLIKRLFISDLSRNFLNISKVIVNDTILFLLVLYM